MHWVAQRLQRACLHNVEHAVRRPLNQHRRAVRERVDAGLQLTSHPRQEGHLHKYQTTECTVEQRLNPMAPRA